MKFHKIFVLIFLVIFACEKSFDPYNNKIEIFGKWQGKYQIDNTTYDVLFEFLKNFNYKYTRLKAEYNYSIYLYGSFNIISNNIIGIHIDSSEFNNQMSTNEIIDTLIYFVDNEYLFLSEDTRSLIQLTGEKIALLQSEFYYSELHDHVNNTYWHYKYYFIPDSVYIHYTVTNNSEIPDNFDFTFKFECIIESQIITFKRHDGVYYQRVYVFDRDKLYMGNKPIYLKK